MLERFHKRIAEKAEDNSTPPVLIIPLGDSVTQGCTVIDVIDHQNAYHNVLKQKLEDKYPKTTFSVYNAGVGGENAGDGQKRLERDVIRHDPDLVIVGFCLNDSCGGSDNLEEYVDNMRNIITRVKAETSADIIVLTPNFMATSDNPNIVPEHQKHIKVLVNCQQKGILKAYKDALKKLAEKMDIPVADVYEEWQKMADGGIDTNAHLANGLNHPFPEGHKLIAETVFKLIENSAQ